MPNGIFKAYFAYYFKNMTSLKFQEQKKPFRLKKEHFFAKKGIYTEGSLFLKKNLLRQNQTLRHRRVTIRCQNGEINTRRHIVGTPFNLIIANALLGVYQIRYLPAR